MARARRDYRSLLRLLAGALAIWLLLGLDPFGIGAATHLAAERMAVRMTAPFYFNERPAVTVVLIDDAYLDQAGRSWPLSYADQGRLARTLLSYRPDALFLDILYRHPHGVGDDPEDLLRDLRARRAVRGRPTPVFIAAFAPPATGADESGECVSAQPAITAQEAAANPPFIGVIPELAGSDLLGRAYIGWERCGNRYPLLIGGDEAIPSPAFALYRAHCEAPEASRYSGCNLQKRFAERQGAAGTDRRFAPMTVQWGAFPSAAQSGLYAAGVCQRPAPEQGAPSFGMRLGTMLRQAYRSLVGDVEQAADPDIRLPCPAVDVIRASQIPEGFSEQLRPFLENRMVLVGSYLDGLPDLYLSPVNGQVSGVVAHAAALDNLLNLDDRYVKDLPAVRSFMLELVVLLLAVVALWRFPLGDALKSLNTGIVSLAIWGLLAAVALSVGERGAAMQLVVVGLVMDWFKPKAAVQVAVLGLVGAILGLILFQFGFVAFNWINIVLSAWGTAELVKSLQSDAKKRDEVEKISLLRSLGRRVWPGAG